MVERYLSGSHIQRQSRLSGKLKDEMCNSESSDSQVSDSSVVSIDSVVQSS